MAWLSQSAAFWRIALKAPLGIEGMGSLLLVLGVTFAPMDRWLENPSVVFWIRIAAWALFVGVVLVYAPGKLIDEHIQRLITRDRAYRVFHKLLQAGERLHPADRLRQEWDAKVRLEISHFLKPDRLEGFLLSTGRIDLRDGITSLSAENLDAALSFIRQELRGEFESSLKRPG